MKSNILARSSTFMLQKELIALPLNILMSLYFGIWCDRYRRGIVLTFYAAVIGQLIENILLTLNSYFFDWSHRYLLLTGFPTNILGNGLFIAALGFVSTNFPQKQRALRFISMDVFINTFTALAYYFSGFLLSSDTFLLLQTPLHNYADVFLVGVIIYCLLILWILFLIPTQSHEAKPSQGRDVNENQDNQDNTSHDERTALFNQSQRSCCSRLCDMFSLLHFKDAFLVVFKKRNLQFHKTLWWLLIYLNLVTLPIIGSVYIYYPLVEKLYGWGYVTYSRMQTITSVIKPFITLFMMPFFFKIFKPRDLQVIYFIIYCFNLICNFY